MACGNAAARQHQQFQRIVERRRIAAARLDDGEQLLDIVAEQRRGQHALPRVHPVHVAAHRIDLAVVRDVAVRVRQLPGGKRVGAEALVHQAQRAHHFRVFQFGIEIGDLRRQQQALINDRARRKRRHVEEALLGNIALGDLGLGALAHHVELALQLVLRHALAARHEDLLDVRLRIARHAADGRAVDRRIAPAAARVSPSSRTMRSTIPSHSQARRAAPPAGTSCPRRTRRQAAA